MQAVANLKEIEKKANKDMSKETISKLCDISPFLHQSNRVLNVIFTETQRKAKYDVSSTLGWGGGDFRCYSSCSLTEDHRFDKTIIKKMRQKP